MKARESLPAVVLCTSTPAAGAPAENEPASAELAPAARFLAADRVKLAAVVAIAPMMDGIAPLSMVGDQLTGSESSTWFERNLICVSTLNVGDVEPHRRTASA